MKTQDRAGRHATGVAAAGDAMPNKLLVIEETFKKSAEHAGLRNVLAKFWDQLPQNRFEKDQAVRAGWYNIDLESWNPKLADENIDAVTTERIGYWLYRITIKIPTNRPIVYFTHEHPQYLERLEYNKANGISVETKEIVVNGNWEEPNK